MRDVLLENHIWAGEVKGIYSTFTYSPTGVIEATED
jgi:hypothetical protein